ncbi:hypothetical protein ACS0TY_019761 [Phlomoides rotata]
MSGVRMKVAGRFKPCVHMGRLENLTSLLSCCKKMRKQRCMLRRLTTGGFAPLPKKSPFGTQTPLWSCCKK